MGFLKSLYTTFHELKPFILLWWSNPSNRTILSGLHYEDLHKYYSSFRKDLNRHKVTKIQHIKFNVTFSNEHHFEPHRYLEGLIVETNFGRDGRPVPDSRDAGTLDGSKRFLIFRSRGASTRVLEDVIGDCEIAGWIKDLVRDGPHPTPQLDDNRLGNTDVLVSKYTPE